MVHGNVQNQVANLQDDNKALERLTKTKEAALLEAEKEVHSAKIKASFVDDLLNRNQELVKQNDICQVTKLFCILQLECLIFRFFSFMEST